jgi:hypothetical protein
VIFHAGILALLLGALIAAGMLALAAWHGVEVLRFWDLSSGSALQLSLERRTYLISTLVAYALAFELGSLFLFAYTADGLAPQFTGAMCAAGTLGANRFGYPALLAGLASFVLAGLWLILNHADNLARDYPLIRPKYAFLLGLAGLVLFEVYLRARYFLGLDPEVITSCCGSLFSGRGRTLSASLAALPTWPTALAFYGSIAVAAGAGLFFRLRGGAAAAAALGLSSAAALAAGLVALISFISPYVYELPTHRCPFCMLQAPYGHVGYAFYAALLGGAVCGMGAGVLVPFRRIPSLAAVLPAFQKKLALAAAALLAALGGLATWVIARSHLVQ